MYLKIKNKFIIAMMITLIYTVFCCILNVRWYNDLCIVFPSIISIMIIIGVAVLPGILMCIMICSVLLDKPRNHEILPNLPDLSIIIAAYNEEKCIYETLDFLNRQKYNGNLYTIVVDNNSSDDTKNEIFRAQEDFPNLNIRYLFEIKQGKFNALNNGLQLVETEYIITLDADTIVYRNALNQLVTTMIMESKTKAVGAVVGTVLVRNSRTNLLTKLQEWDYFLSITGIKRSQGLFQSTLVAQGAFSLYKTSILKEIGGWTDSIGEDIVLSWEFLYRNYKIHYDPKSVAFTTVPNTFKVFRRQRSRWARGMVEGLKQRPFWKYPTIYSKTLIGFDILLFFIDFSIIFFWIPGLLAALFFRNFAIVGPMTLLLLPLTILMFGILFGKEYRTVFKLMNLKVRKHFFSFFVFLFTYQLIMSPISFIGYIQEFLKIKRRWK